MDDKIFQYIYLRNASSHVTPDECQTFRNGNWTFKEFPGEKDWESIWTKLDNAVQDCLDIGVKIISNERKRALLNDLKLTRKESVKFLEKYFEDDISKQQKFIIEQLDIQTQLGEISASQGAMQKDIFELNKKLTSTQANKNMGNVFSYRMFIILILYRHCIQQ